VLLNHLEAPNEARFGANPIEKRDALIKTTLAAAVARTKKLLGDDPGKWNWGHLHRAPFDHPLANLGPSYAKAFNLAAVPRAGDSHTPHNTRHNDSFQQIHGASYRQLLDLSDWDKGLATSTPGQSGQLGSPHYGDLLPLWADQEYFPLTYTRPKVEEVTRHRLRLRP
jgi:penicillin amidase